MEPEALNLRHDFGLRDFIKKYRCEVFERYADGFTILDLLPAPNIEAYTRGVSVVISNGCVRGAKAGLYPSGIVAAVAGEGIMGYEISGKTLCVGRRNPYHGMDFEGFLWTAASQSHQHGGAWILYASENGVFQPLSAFLEHCHLCIWDGYSEYYEDGVAAGVTRQDGMIAATEMCGNSVSELVFPERTDESYARKLEQILMTDADWLDLPRQMPILRLSRTTRP